MPLVTGASGLLVRFVLDVASVAALSVTGETVCPVPAHVAAQVEATLPPGVLATVDERVELALDDGALVVSLRRPDGATIAERRFEPGFGCAELAGAAALVVAGWLSDAHPEFVPPAPTLPAPAPAPAAPPAPVATATAQAPVAVPPRPYDLGVAGVGVANDAFTPGLGLFATVMRRASGFGLGARATVSSYAAASFAGAGTLQWTRPAFALGPRFRAPLRPTALLEAGADAVLALLTLRGQGFNQDLGSSAWALGLGANARIGWAFGRWQPFLAVIAHVYPRPEAVVVGGVDGVERTIPPLDLLLALGVSFRAGS